VLRREIGVKHCLANHLGECVDHRNRANLTLGAVGKGRLLEGLELGGFEERPDLECVGSWEDIYIVEKTR
jgi:hypothetical protein